MKFHCDRCKTRYSISEERVRGKILKIRCKNCSAVITVREEGTPLKKPLPAPARKPERSGPSSLVAEEKPTKHERPSALAGAYAKALANPSPVPDAGDSLSAPPQTLEAEWFVAVDGQQHGPYSLEEARDWVRARAPDAEVHCWSEGFEDWLPAEKLSHFRGLRSQPSPSGFDEATVVDGGNPLLRGGAVSSPITAEETPKPLFAATMAQVERDASHSDVVPEPDRSPLASPPPSPAAKPAVPKPGLPKPGLPKPALPNAARSGPAKPNFPGPPSPLAAKPPTPAASKPADSGANGESDADLELDIGEASRVVKLPMLAGMAGSGQNASPASGEGGGLPGMSRVGRGTGKESSVDIPPSLLVTSGGEMAPRPEILTPKRKREHLVLILVAAVLLAGVVGVLLFFALAGDDDSGSSGVARGSVGGGGDLGYTFGDPARPKKDGEKPDETDKSEKKTGRRGGKRSGNGSSGKTTTNGKKNNYGPVSEVNLGGDEGASGPLDGDDLMSVYRANQYLIKRCYERALKKDPFMKVPKTWVTIQVSKAGSVTNVAIPSLAGTDLGTCLTATISRWRFRKSTETFNSRFPVVFGS